MSSDEGSPAQHAEAGLSASGAAQSGHSAAQWSDEDRLRVLSRAVEQSPNTVAITDLDGNLLYVNPRFTELTGYTREEVLGKNPRILRSGTQSNAFYAELWQTILARGVWKGEFHNVRKDGSAYWELASIAPVQDDSGRPVYFVKVAEDITARRQAEANLQESEARFRSLFESSPDAVFLIHRRSGCVLDANPAALRLLDLTYDQVSHLRDVDLVTQDVTGKPVLLSDAPSSPLEALIRRYGQPDRYVEILVRPITLQGEEVLLCTFRDITAHAKAERALQGQAAELQARNDELDAFAHTVAHDLKNPISLILGAASLLTLDCETMTPQEIRRAADLISRIASKADGIVNDLLLLASSRTRDVPTGPVDMHSIVSEAILRLSRLIEERHARFTLPETWPAAVGYAPWVEEIWINYLSNALKYGGDPPIIVLGADLCNETTVRFWVRDNGPGIPKEQQERLFTPFTRLSQSQTPGHGLGLSIVRRITGRLLGEVGVESPETGGSTFWFTLPRA